MRHAALFLSIGLGLEVVTVGITISAVVVMRDSEAKERQAQFERIVDRAVVTATARLEQYATVLRAGVGLYDASKSVEREEWREFSEALDIDRKFPGSNGFGHIQRLQPTEVDAFIQQQRADGAPTFAIRSLNPKAIPRDLFVINYLEPLARNGPAIGLDIGSETIRREAAEAAIASGEVRATRMITLVQDQAKKPGFLMLAPHYRSKRIPGTEAERIADGLGWVYAPFVGERILHDLIDTQADGVGISIYDGVVDEAHRIADGGSGDPNGLSTQRRVAVAGQDWIFSATTTAAFPAPAGSTFPVLLAGMAASTGMLVVLLLLHRSSRQALNLAKAATQEAQEAGEAKTRFLAVMSHEIRTPLNGVIGMAELALQEVLSITVRHQIQTMHASGQTLLALVNDILDFSRIASGQMTLEQVPFNARQEVTTVLTLLRDGAQARGLTVTAEGPEHLWVQGDPLRFRQILLNLVGNALKFTAQGGVTIVLQPGATGLGLEIRDTGIGMTPEQVSRLFTPFTQADTSTSRRFGGTGLGLSIVKRLVDIMGGTIRIDSVPDQGTRFILALPLPPVDPVVATRMIIATPQAASLGLRVLLAEDVITNQMVAKAMLKKLGCTVTVVGDGAAAVTQAAGHDVILMDCQMPVVDGFEATRQLRAAGCTIPIIALTANASDDDRKACEDVGMVGFLTKPLQQDRLRQALMTTPRNT